MHKVLTSSDYVFMSRMVDLYLEMQLDEQAYKTVWTKRRTVETLYHSNVALQDIPISSNIFYKISAVFSTEKLSIN